MKRLAGFCLWLSACFLVAGASFNLDVAIVPQFDDEPLVFDSLSHTTAAGQTISVTRLDFLMSDVALRRTDGVWLGQHQWVAFLNLREGKTNFTIPGLPAARYDRVRFHIGLPPALNHANAAQWPAGHPLNPDVNRLYWGWSRQYVFLALEGRWQNGPRQDGFSFHLATDAQLMTVERPVDLDLTERRTLRLPLDVGKIFAAPHKIELTESADSTHSRPGDGLAARARENAQAAFGPAESVPSEPAGLSPTVAVRPLMARNATPYRLAFSQFFPRPNLPRDNPLTGEGVALGSKLFFDRRLSLDNAQACANCHRPRLAFSQAQRFSRGVDGELGARHAMSLENLAWKDSFFWDGRARTLREQVLQPIQNPIEMHESLSNAVAKIAADADYGRLFQNAFGSPVVTPDRIARALEQFLLTQVSCHAKFDRVLNGREKFTAEEERGFILFNTEYDPYHGQFGADCFHCHGGPLLQSQSFANNGLDTTFHDVGRYAVTRREGDRGKFAVPSLRNVAVTGPYMHDGRFRSLEAVIEHYCSGVKRSATLDPNLAKHPDGGIPLSLADKRALAAFLRTLTDDRFAAAEAVGQN